MKYNNIGTSDLSASNLVMGCMRLNTLTTSEAETLIRTALEHGVNLFDHADIYGSGACETLFGQAIDLSSSLRETLLIQSKCGIRNGYFDFSYQHIVQSVEGSLTRLGTDYLDLLLLHRPDTLMEPEEVAKAFDHLETSGKVRYFGVSNQNSMQMELLKKSVAQPLVANQLQFSLAHTPMIDSGLATNMSIGQSVERTGSIVEYCRLNNITIQAWSPFQQGFFDGPYLGDTKNYSKLNEVIDRLAKHYGVSNTAIAVAWITRHPANIQVILGTTQPQRFRDSCDGSELTLTRQEWYELYTAAGNILP